MQLSDLRASYYMPVLYSRICVAFERTQFYNIADFLLAAPSLIVLCSHGRITSSESNSTIDFILISPLVVRSATYALVHYYLPYIGSGLMIFSPLSRSVSQVLTPKGLSARSVPSLTGVNVVLSPLEDSALWIIYS